MDELFYFVQSAFQVLSSAKFANISITAWLVVISVFGVIGLFINGRR